MEAMGLLKAIPLVIIKAVTESAPANEIEEDSEDEDSEPEVESPMPKHFENDDLYELDVTEFHHILQRIVTHL